MALLTTEIEANFRVAIISILSVSHIVTLICLCGTIKNAVITYRFLYINIYVITSDSLFCFAFFTLDCLTVLSFLHPLIWNRRHRTSTWKAHTDLHWILISSSSQSHVCHVLRTYSGGRPIMKKFTIDLGYGNLRPNSWVYNNGV